MKGRPSKRVTDGEESGDVLKGLPPCPRDFSPAAKKCWKQLCQTIGKTGKLNKADWSAMEQYCIVYARWKEAESQIDSTGGTVLVGMKENKDGEQVPSGGLYQNPFLCVANTALDKLRELGKRLGLDPMARDGLGIKSSTAQERKGVARRDRSKSSLPPPVIAGKVG